MSVSFISCVKEKRKGKYKAKDLYISDFFKKSLKYCLNTHDKVYILSAKYGLLDLEDMIEDYDMTLNDFSKSQRIEWSDKVYEQVQPRIDESDTFTSTPGSLASSEFTDRVRFFRAAWALNERIAQ